MKLNSKLAIHHIAVKVKDLDKAIAFYRDVLGLKYFTGWETDWGEKACLMDTGNNRYIELFSGATDQELENQSIVHFSFRTIDVDNAYKAAIAGGATSVYPPKVKNLESSPVLIRIKTAVVLGPGGEKIEFFQMVRRGAKYSCGQGF